MSDLKTPPTDAELPNRGARITPIAIEANIVSEHYFTAAEGDEGAQLKQNKAAVDAPAPLALLTFCVLILRNGFTVTGESACAAPENFDAEIGKRVARQAAVAKVWPLMGYALRSELARAALFNAGQIDQANAIY